MILADTNVLLYAYDQNESERQRQAAAILRELEVRQRGRLSVQNLAEFFSVSTRKLKPPLTPSQALEQVQMFASTFPILSITPLTVLEAARGVRDHQLAYHDAQLWAIARLNQIQVIFTEDLPSRLEIEAVRFVNPFATGFLLERWI